MCALSDHTEVTSKAFPQASSEKASLPHWVWLLANALHRWLGEVVLEVLHRQSQLQTPSQIILSNINLGSTVSCSEDEINWPDGLKTRRSGLERRLSGLEHKPGFSSSTQHWVAYNYNPSSRESTGAYTHVAVPTRKHPDNIFKISWGKKGGFRARSALVS